MERDDLLRTTAQRYADAQLYLEQADRDAGAAKTRADGARIERDRIEKSLREFVGRNVPRKLIVLKDSSRAVLIQLDLAKDGAVYVSLEQCL